MGNWLRTYKLEIILLTIMSVFLSIVTYLQLQGCCITFLDNDDYMRLVRIQDFFDSHQNLADHIIERGNYPFGCDLHWTRFYDFFLIIPAYIVKLFIGSSHVAIKYVGFVISPVMKVVTATLLLRLFQKLMKNESAFLATVLFIAYPLLFNVFSFGRPDHHAFIMLFIVLYMCNLASVIETKFKDHIAIVRVAVTASLCIWISPETLIPLLLSDAVLFISTFFDKDQTNGLIAKNLLTAVFLGIIVFIFAPIHYEDLMAIFALFITASLVLYEKKWGAIVGFILALALIRVYGAYFTVEYDKISVVHVSLYLASTVFFGINVQFQKLKVSYRTLYYALSLCFIGVLFLVTYPRFLYGMSGDVSSYVKTIWLNRISEMQSPFQHGEYISFALYCAIVAFATLIKLQQLSSKAFSSSVLWWTVVIISTCYTICSGFSCRMLPYSILFSLPIIVSICMEYNPLAKLHRYWRIFLAFFCTILFVFCSTILDNCTDSDESEKNKGYTEEELFTELDKLSPTPVVIMAHSDDGAKILYYTKHKAVGAPYHRQQQGIISAYEVMEAAYNREVVNSHLRNTESAYILIRKPSPDANKHDLPHMIANGKIPSGMTRVELPKKFDDIIVLKIDKRKI
ncbi:MAG: hypothetical protein K6C34_01640 [Alphaproteobacteria bacterium]|nr:hypothetical protein [Alphaproteobacteria bacterium]